MTTGPARWLVGGLPLMLLTTLSGPVMARPAAVQTTDDSSVALPVQLYIDGLAPRVVRPHTNVIVAGHVRNSSDQVIDDVRVRVRVRSRPVGSRSELAADAVRTDPLGDIVSATTTPVAASLPAGASQQFTVQVPADSLHLGVFGVYPFAVEALGSDSGGPNDIVGRTPTFLPWVPPDQIKPIRLGWVLPLVDPPNRPATPVFPDDHLAASLASTASGSGRLGAVLAAGARVGPRVLRPLKATKKRPDPQRPVPVTWAVDPALLQSVADMSDVGTNVYRVATGHGRSTQAGAGQPAAANWLTTLRTSVQGGSGSDAVLALPYANADVTALARAGLDGDITKAISYGRAVASSVTGVAADPSLNWPPGGYVTTKALDDLAASGIHTVLLREDALPLRESLTYTPNAGAPIDTSSGTATALLYDATLARIVAASDRDALDAAATSSPVPSSSPSESSPTPSPVEQTPTAAPTTARLLEQRFLAETALIAAEHFVTRDVVVTAPQEWNPVPGLAADLVADAGRVPWIVPTLVSDMHADDTIAREPLTYPEQAATAELPKSYLTDKSEGVVAMRRELTSFRSILAPPVGQTAVSLDNATMRAESAAWRDNLSAGIALRDEIANELRDKHGAVAIASSQRLITLASRRGTIPITISNDLDQAVVIRLRLSAVNSARLSAPVSAPQTIAAGRKLTYEVKAVVNQAGLFPIKAQLLTPDGEAYGPAVTLRLRSTAYGRLTLGITAGALGALFLAIVIRLWRRARRRRTPQPAESR